MFDLPEDSGWGQEYFGGIFIVFNEAVLKSDVLDDIKDAANLNPKAIRFLSIFKDEFEEVDIEDDIQDYSLEDIKKYFYLYIKGDLISEALGTKMDADALGESEYRFAFVVASGASNKDFLAESIKKQVPQVKRTLVV